MALHLCLVGSARGFFLCYFEPILKEELERELVERKNFELKKTADTLRKSKAWPASQLYGISSPFSVVTADTLRKARARTVQFEFCRAQIIWKLARVHVDKQG
jgi:hypothetical protein